jgi:hypothetical protein
MTYNTAVIRDLLQSALDDQDLMILCFDHFPPVYKQFAPQMSFLWKIQLLIAHCQKHNQFNILLDHMKQRNPVQYAKFYHQITTPSSVLIPLYDHDICQIVLKIRGDLSSFTADQKDIAISAAIGALAGALHIPSDQIRVLHVQDGSVILHLEMPKDAAERLAALYREHDSIIRDLGIEHVSVIHQLSSQFIALSTILRAEIYIVNLLKTSAHARRVTSARMGHRTLFDSEGMWMRLPLQETLETLSAQLKCPQDMVFTRLATEIKHSVSDRPASGEVHLDTLALVHIRQRTKWITEQLREQAQELVDAVGPSVPADSDLARLRPCLMMYELRSPAEAWRTVLKLQESVIPSIREKLAAIDFRSTGMSGSPKAGHYLNIRTEEIWSQPPRWQFWKKPQLVGTKLIVSCAVEEFEQAVDILSFHNVPPSQIASLEQLFAALPGDIAGQSWASDIGARLVEARPIAFMAPRDIIVNACLQLYPEIIRGLILAGIDLPGVVHPLWEEQLSYKLPVTPVPESQDTIFPLSRAEILDLTRQEYLQQDGLRIVE